MPLVREVRIRPGSHTVVVMYNAGNAVSQDAVEFKMRFEAGIEYQLRVEANKKFFRKGHWEPFLAVRPVSSRPPEKAAGS
jgi:hypothetical protein